MSEQNQNLTNAPLVEAIFEIHWKLSTSPNLPNLSIDPNYKILVGRFFERVQKEYKFMEPLPSLKVDPFVNTVKRSNLD